MTDSTSSTLTKVKVKRRIGRGGMADVYLGEHSTLGHQVAVKVLHAHLLEDEEHQRRFHAEAKAVAALRHPHIVQVYDFQLVDGRPLIIMELLDGPSLSDYVAPIHQDGRRLPLAHAVKIVSQIGDALDHAHAQGIVHRDVKPANVVLRSGSTVIQPNQALPDDVTAVLTDFGVARLANASTATATGTILGTPAYMAPEQVLGETVGPRADIYALGVVLYELLTGRVPFGSEDTTPAALLFKHVHEDPNPLPGKLGQMQDIVSRALAKRPEERYMTAGDFVVDLKRAAKGKGPEPVTMKGRRPRAVQREASANGEASDHRWVLWAGGLAGLVVTIVAGLLIGLAAFGGGDLLGGGVDSTQSQLTPNVVGGAMDPTPSETTAETIGSGVEIDHSPTSSASTNDTMTPTAARTDTAAPATATSTAGNTPVPSATRIATDTPRPTATKAPTETPRPTATKAPTDTPEPTATKAPTRTPTPTPLLDLVDPID